MVSNGTYFVRGARVRKFICRHCGHVFNSRARTPFRWLHTPRWKVLLALRLLVKGLSLHGTAEVMQVKLDTARRWLRRAGQHSEAISRTLAFSKKRREFQHQLDFRRAYANIVRPHRSVRAPAPRGSGPRRWLPRTPAMAADLANHVWTLEEVLEYKHRTYQP